MSDFTDSRKPHGNVTRLSDVMREVRIAQADRSDVVVDMKEADRARLELLALELKPLFDDIPADNDLFDFAISSGLQPRLWIDAVSHVQMGRDRRTYRFVRDTRIGRTVLAESVDMRPVADQVTRYVAERLVEQKRLMEGETESLRPQTLSPQQESGVQKPLEVAVGPEHETPLHRFVAGLIWVLIGAVAGGGLLLALLSGAMDTVKNWFN